MKIEIFNNMTLLWIIIIAVVVIGVIWYAMSRKKGPGLPMKPPQGPTTPTPPPETPAM